MSTFEDIETQNDPRRRGRGNEYASLHDGHVRRLGFAWRSGVDRWRDAEPFEPPWCAPLRLPRTALGYGLVLGARLRRTQEVKT
jgi:hypothetical protein